MHSLTRREFIRGTALSSLAAAYSSGPLWAQSRGDRPAAQPSNTIQVLNPMCRVPVGLIIDDSTCLVNLNRFAMPQFDEAHGGRSETYHKPWREWPVEIPDSFVRKFGEWCASEGVKGKYSVVPYPACVGRMDRELPGWTRRELNDSIKLVRELMMPNWDIHPEMITHTRVIDLKTGHPLPNYSLQAMENWEWTTGKSEDQLTAYLDYALQILKEAGFWCEGITTPGGFGNRVLPELSRASLNSVRHVFKAEVPHYFRHLYDEGTESVAPRVEYASDLDSPDPRCVVSIIGCTGDWTGGWDCTPPEGVDKFITADLASGRMVDVITRGEPAFMVCHWTGIFWNGQETGFEVFKEVVRRLKARFNNLVWMKTSEVSRYWAAKELTTVERVQDGGKLELRAPFACPAFTVRVQRKGEPAKNLGVGSMPPLDRVTEASMLKPGTWLTEPEADVLCFDLSKGKTTVRFES